MTGSNLVKTTPRRVKRMQKNLDEAHKTYDDIVNIAGPRLRDHEEGRAILDHTDMEIFGVWRAKAQVKKLEAGLMKVGWFEKNILPLLKFHENIDVKKLEYRIRHLIFDSANTSAKAEQFLAALPEYCSTLIDLTDEADIPETASYLMTRYPGREIANNKYGGTAPDPRPHSQLL